MNTSEAETARIRLDYEKLSPLAKQVVTRLGLEVMGYGFVKTPGFESTPERIHIEITNFNKICFLIAGVVTEMHL